MAVTENPLAPAVDTTAKKRLLRERLPRLYELLEPCSLCPRGCLSLRRQGELGECGIGDQIVVSSIFLHRGNEYPISGYRGSGNIFVSGCNLHCVFCQNWTVSQLRDGTRFTPEQLSAAMLRLQEQGAHNINVVTPTHVVPMLMEALLIAYEHGLTLPFVYNCGGYESLEVIGLLDGIVDIYLPDMKFNNADAARQYSDIINYPQHNRAAVKEMYRQVGTLVFDDYGVAQRGLLVRHLALPDDVGGSREVLNFLDTELGGPVFVNIMSQYRPCFKAGEFPPLDRRIKREEYEAVLDYARRRPNLRLVE